MTATLVRRVDASLDDLKAVVDGERARARVRAAATTRRGGERRVRAETLEDLLAETRRLADAGTLDLPAAVAVQRAAGGIAARSGMRLVLFLARLAVIRRLVWDRCVDEQRAGRLDADVAGRDGPLDLPVDRDHLAGRHGRLPGRRARDPRPRRPGPPQRPRGAPGRRRIGRAHRRQAAPGRHPVRAGPGRALPAGGRRPAPGGGPDARPGRHRRGRPRAPRRPHRTSPRVGGRGHGGRRRRDPPARRAADARPHRPARAGRLGGLRPDHPGAGRHAGRPGTGRPVTAGRAASAGQRRAGGTTAGPRSRRPGWPWARRSSKAWRRSPASSRTWSTPCGRRRTSACAAGSRIPATWPWSGCSWPSATSARPPSPTSWARSWPTSGWVRS